MVMRFFVLKSSSKNCPILVRRSVSKSRRPIRVRFAPDFAHRIFFVRFFLAFFWRFFAHRIFLNRFFWRFFRFDKVAVGEAENEFVGFINIYSVGEGEIGFGGLVEMWRLIFWGIT